MIKSISHSNIIKNHWNWSSKINYNNLGDFIIACGEGAISVTHIQKPGKRITSAREFLRGNKLPEILA